MFGPFSAEVRSARGYLLMRSEVTFGGNVILAYKEPLKFQVLRLASMIKHLHSYGKVLTANGVILRYTCMFQFSVTTPSKLARK